MSEEKYAQLRFVAISALSILFLFLFYSLGATRVLEFFPEPKFDSFNVDVPQGLDMLMIWAGSGVAIMGICAVIFAFAIFRMSELGGWIKRYSYIWSAILVGAAAAILLTHGNSIAELAIKPQCHFEVAQNTLCDIGKAEESKESREATLDEVGWTFLLKHQDDKSYGVAIVRLKYTLNFFFQTAAITVLSLMVILSTARRVFGFVDESRIREAYLVSALVLSLVIISDALFFDFLRQTIGPEDRSGYIPLQKGLLFYFAIISTATLALALSMCSLIGKVPLMLSGDGAPVGSDAAFLDRVKGFFTNPGFATAFATFAPMLSAFVTQDALGV
ncbi:MAG: hypothetical protein ACKVGV_12195 [Sphingomonadales bacterium]